MLSERKRRRQITARIYRSGLATNQRYGFVVPELRVDEIRVPDTRGCLAGGDFKPHADRRRSAADVDVENRWSARRCRSQLQRNG